MEKEHHTMERIAENVENEGRKAKQARGTARAGFLRPYLALDENP